MFVAIAIGARSARRNCRLSRHHLFGKRVSFLFVNIIGRADGKFGLENSGRYDASNGAVPNRALQAENWIPASGKALKVLVG